MSEPSPEERLAERLDKARVFAFAAWGRGEAPKSIALDLADFDEAATTIRRLSAERDEARKKCQELNRRAQEEYSRGVKDCSSKRNAGRILHRNEAKELEAKLEAARTDNLQLREALQEIDGGEPPALTFLEGRDTQQLLLHIAVLRNCAREGLASTEAQPSPGPGRVGAEDDPAGGGE